MRRNFIVDKEISLSNDNDFLNTKVYAHTLQKMIRNVPEKRPFTIGLFGEWGSGKSSIIKTAKEQLEKSDTFKVKFAVFDAWKYSEDAFRRSFILSLAKQLGVSLPKHEYNLYENQTEQINEFKIKISGRTWALLIGILVLLLGLYIFVPWIKTQLQALTSLISVYLITATVWILLSAIVNKELLVKCLKFIQSLVFIKYDNERPLMFSPEQFSTAFEHLVDKTTLHLNRLVIVIDNIDRCEKNYATELLTTIKGFLESRDNVLFILPVDESALKRHIREVHKADDREADEFLRKFFNATLRIKHYQSSEIYMFAKEINKKYGLLFSDYTLDLVSKEYASNPRRIIQMFNNLTAELECYSDEIFTTQFETLICKLLIVREEFPRYYNVLSKNPYLINMDEESFDKLHAGIWTKNLGNFLRKTSVISETVNIKVISQILSNSIVFNALPSEIEGYIDNLQIDEIKTFISGDSEKLSIITDYLIQQLDIYKERNLIGNVFINSLDILMKLESEKLLSRTVNMRIEEIIKSSLIEIFQLKKDLNDILKYGANLQEQQRDYITQGFLSIIDAQFSAQKPPEKWLDALEIAIKTYQDKKTLKRLSKAFIKAYEIAPSYLDKSLSSDKISSLADKGLYQFILQKVTTLAGDDTYFSDLKFILEHDRPSQEIVKSTINRINEIYAEFTNKGVSEITSVVQSINSLLSIFKIDLANSNELQVISSVISSDRAIHNPSYPNHRQYDTPQNYVSEILSGQDSIVPLLDFYFNIFRLSLGQIDIVPFLNKVVATSKYQEQLNSKILELFEIGADITPLFQIIIKDASYTESSFKLLQQVFTENPSGLTDELRQQKLEEMLNLIENDDPRKAELISFLEQIGSDEKVREILSNLISSRGKAGILKLSKTLQSLAIDKVLDGEKIFDFSNNIDFLKVIAETGTKGHVSKLVKDILSKLQHKDQHANAITIITEIKNISIIDSNRIIHELEHQSIENVTKEEIEDIIKTLKRIAKS